MYCIYMCVLNKKVADKSSMLISFQSSKKESGTRKKGEAEVSVENRDRCVIL